MSSLDPYKTIPPFEDQNNRNIPKDFTLLLNNIYMKKYYANWQKWVQLLIPHNDLLLNKLDHICNYPDRKLAKNQLLDKETRINLYFLQRLLDITAEHCIYGGIRYIVGSRKHLKNEAKNRIDEEELKSHLENHYDDFIKFAREYYKSQKQAKSGMYIADNNSLFIRANTNPPQKNKVSNMLVSNILQIKPMTLNNKDKLKEMLDKKHDLLGRKSSLILKDLEDIRKTDFENNGSSTKLKDHVKGFIDDLSNESINMSTLTKKHEKAIKKIIEENEYVFNTSDKGLIKYTKNLLSIDIISHDIENFIKNIADDEDQIDVTKFNNLFSLLQLYNTLYTDINGFARNSKAIIMENNWRSTPVINENTGEYTKAPCSRMVADSTRPFDGVLSKIFNAVSSKIVKKIDDFIKDNNINKDDLSIHIIIEENQFNFKEGLFKAKNYGDNHKIKKKYDKNQEKKYDNYNNSFQSKEERLRASAHNICAYTGANLNETTCEIDHIYPQSLSLKNYNTTFNHEMNLMYISSEANQTKTNILQSLSDLKSKKYRIAVFGTSDIPAIEQMITETVNKIFATKNKLRINFLTLTEKEQQHLRHALFMPNTDVFKQAVDYLNSQSIANRVNGTQKYVARQILEKLNKQYNKRFDGQLIKIDNKKISILRQQLAKFNEKYKKDFSQSPISHVYDAMLALEIYNQSKHKKGKSIEKLDEWIQNHSTQNFSKSKLQSKPLLERDKISTKSIFKDSTYASNFIPLAFYNNTLVKGFLKEKNYHEVIDSKKDKDFHLFKKLAPFMKHLGKELDLNNLKYQFTSMKESSKNNKWLQLYIDKQKAIDFLFKVEKQSHSTDESESYDELIKLEFFTGKTNYKDIICEDINKKKFNIVKKDIKIGKLYHPVNKVIIEIINLLNDGIDDSYNSLLEKIKSLKDSLTPLTKQSKIIEQDIKDKPKDDEESILLHNTKLADLQLQINELNSNLKELELEQERREKAVENYIQCPNEKTRKAQSQNKLNKHKSHRRARSISIPIKNSPNVRIRRKTPTGYIYQTYAFENNLVSTAVYMDKNKVYEAIKPDLITKNVTPIKQEYKKIDSSQFIDMNEEINIKHLVHASLQDYITDIQVCYGTKIRRKINLTLNLQGFNDLFESQNDNITTIATNKKANFKNTSLLNKLAPVDNIIYGHDLIIEDNKIIIKVESLNKGFKMTKKESELFTLEDTIEVNDAVNTLIITTDDIKGYNLLFNQNVKESKEINKEINFEHTKGYWYELLKPRNDELTMKHHAIENGHITISFSTQESFKKLFSNHFNNKNNQGNI